MAWKEFDLSEIPENELVLVSHSFYGPHLRRFTDDDSYDEDENYDDSEIVWECWAKLPD